MVAKREEEKEVRAWCFIIRKKAKIRVGQPKLSTSSCAQLYLTKAMCSVKKKEIRRVVALLYLPGLGFLFFNIIGSSPA
jgi:hypothetical protein